MTKSLLLLLKATFIATLLVMPMAVNAQDAQRTPVEMESNQVSVFYSESTLKVKNADGMVIEIFSLTGERKYIAKIEGQSKSIDLTHLQRGPYIVRIGKYTRKIYLH